MEKIVQCILLVSLILSLGCGAPQTSHHEEGPSHSAVEAGNPGALLVLDMINACGGLEAYRHLHDVEYTYIYQADSLRDVSTERYIYQGEKSWARYDTHTYTLFPNDPGVVIQGYNGLTTWTSKDGQVLKDDGAIARADFLRKTNFYWFNMMFKLLDPGTQFEKVDDRQFNGQDYYVVKVTFGEDVGDAQDIYVLYINKTSKLVDQFLFTVMDFGRSEPLLMEVTYESVNNMQWPTYRRYTSSDWEATVAADARWTEEISQNLRFNTGLTDDLFELPQVE